MGPQHPGPRPRPGRGRPGRRRGPARVPAAADQPAGRRHPRRPSSGHRRRVVRGGRAQAVERRRTATRTIRRSSTIDGSGRARGCIRWSRSAGTASTWSTSRRRCRTAPRRVAGAAYLHNATELGVAPLRAAGRRRATAGCSPASGGPSSSTSCDRGWPAGVRGAAYADPFLSSRGRAQPSSCSRSPPHEIQRPRAVRPARRAAAGLPSSSCTPSSGPRAGDRRRVIIVTGGPGSGKSVIALSLLGELARQGRTVLHATGSRSFTADAAEGRRQGLHRGAEPVQVLQQLHGRRPQRPGRADPRRGAPDPGDVGQPVHARRASRTGRPQVDELIAAARVPVFLLDEHQVVRPGEIGHRRTTSRRTPRALGLAVHEDRPRRPVPLRRQRGVRGLGAAAARPRPPGGPVPWPGDPAFRRLRSPTHPQELEAVLAIAARARATAPG